MEAMDRIDIDSELRQACTMDACKWKSDIG